MRKTNFCCYSLIGIVIFVTAFNIYLLRSLNRESAPLFGWKNEVPVLFSQLPTESTKQYKIWRFFVKSERNLEALKGSNSVDITIITQTSVWNLPDLYKMSEHWDGIISVGIFAPGEDIETALEYIETMRSCNQKIKNFVNFHLVLALSHPPVHKNLAHYITQAESRPRVCGGFSKVNKRNSLKNYANERVPYPVNLLRNVALDGSESTHVLVVDIDMIPVASLLRDFQKNFNAIKRTNAVYVLPTFELEEDHTIPKTKKELVEAWKHGNVRPFYEQVCWKCQKYTDYEKWRRSDYQELSIAYKVDWHDPWEPFFIAEKTSVRYDERFKQYGFNRISQVCETHFSGHDFFVLDNAFLIHRGFKEKKSFHQSKDSENARNRILFRTFKAELKLKYPESTRRC